MEKSFQFKNFSARTVNFGSFKLDGGAMFGSCPKNLWNKWIPGDDQNRITLAQRSLVIEIGNRVFLVDCGMGDKWGAKEREIFDIKNTPIAQVDGVNLHDAVTDLILTHLHFDHAGGISQVSADGSLQKSFSNAQVLLQSANLENARNPSRKERASYLKENVGAIDLYSTALLDGDVEITPEIKVHRVDGHTVGQQWIEVTDGSETVVFGSDVIPTRHHCHLGIHMGYDQCGSTILREKEEFLKFALAKDAWIVFQHDVELACSKVVDDERVGYRVV